MDLHSILGQLRVERPAAIELKYFTRKLDVEVGGEAFSLTDNSAQDIGRYDVLKDVQRLGKAVNEEFVDEGYTVFLTNDQNYWSASTQAQATLFEAFRLTEGRVLTGELAWREGASFG